MTLRTRTPTGAVPYPLLLVEGGEKSGKSYAARALSASDRVGRTFVFDVGEVPSDQYAPLGRFELVELAGTWADLTDQLAAAMKEPATDGRPNVIELDTMTAVWNHLADWANGRARNSAKNRALLERDPDAEIDTPMNLWNDAKDRWWRIVNDLRAWPGIAVLVARGGEVTEVEGGRPVVKHGQTQTVYKVQAEKGLPFAVDAHVRLTRTPRKAQLVSAATLKLNLDDGQPVDLPLERTLEHLIFDVLGAGVTEFAATKTATMEEGIEAKEAKRRLLASAVAHVGDSPHARIVCLKAWADAGLEGVSSVTADQYAAAVDALDAVLHDDPPPPSTDDEPANDADRPDGY